MVGTIWLSLMIIFLLIEIATVGLTSIWLAGGALVAFIMNLFDVGLVWQIGAFFVVSVVLMVFTRPFAKKFNSLGEWTGMDGKSEKYVGDL